MLKEKDLQELRPDVRYKNGKDITLNTIQGALANAAQPLEIPIAFRLDQVKSGLLSSSAEDCLVVYHPEHQKDYFSIAIRVKYQGSYAFISTSTFGMSKRMKSEALRKELNNAAKEGIKYRGYNPLQSAAAGASMLGAGAMGIRHLIKGKSDKEQLEIEQQWYAIVNDLLDDIIS